MMTATYSRLVEIAQQVGPEDRAYDVPGKWRDEAESWQADLTPAALADLWWNALEYLRSGSCETKEEAVQFAAADLHWASWQKEQDRREEEEREAGYQDYLRRTAAVRELAKAVEATLGVSFYMAVSGSCYADYRGLKLRVSDHAQVEGGGYNAGTGERNGEADVEWVADDKVPSRQEIRQAVAVALWEAR